MKRLMIAAWLLLPATVWAAESVPAVSEETSSNKPVADLSSTSETTVTTTPAAKSPRTMSSDTAAKLSAASPKFVSPVTVVPGTAEATETSPVARESDKPRNQIIRLPRYIVEEQKLHVPKEELDVLTPKGRVDYAFKRRPGLKIVPLGWMNAGVALEMLEDDLRTQRRREEADLWSLYLIHEPAPPAK
jgi:hypothetical protein